MRRRPKGEVREIAWHAISAKEQSHQQCRYCYRPGVHIRAHMRATHMRKEGKWWVPLCKKHAGILEPLLPASLRSVS